MTTCQEYVDIQLRPYTDGLWGDTAEVRRTLARLEHALSRELSTSCLDGPALLCAGEIAVARRELPLAERTALVEGVLRLTIAWIDQPLSSRAVAYPMLDALAADDSLPAYLRSDVLNLLEAEARRCIDRLVLDLSEPSPWQGNPSAHGPEDALFDRLGLLPLVHYALDLLTRRSIAARWHEPLAKVIAMAAADLVQDLKAGADFANQPHPYYLLGALLESPCLPDLLRDESRQLLDRFVDSVVEAARAAENTPHEDTIILASGVMEWPCVRDDARAELRAFVERHLPQ